MRIQELVPRKNVVRAGDGRRAVFDQRVRSLAHRIADVARHGEYVTPLIERVPRRDERAGSDVRLDDRRSLMRSLIRPLIRSLRDVGRIKPDGDYFVPAGDCFSVYPGKNGVPYETLRLKAFAGALADARALRLAESIIGREALENTISTLGTDVSSITFDSYPSSPDWLSSMRETVNNLIAGETGKTVLS